MRNNNDIIIVKPDKGNGVIVLDKKVYIESLMGILSDSTKFRKINSDVTTKKEGMLQRFLRDLKKGGFFQDNIYNEIYPVGSLPARMYGLPKMHKCKEQGEIPTFRPIVSSIGTFNYKLAKLLSNMLKPHYLL